ncbi:MAG: cysteine desulfurase family protein [Patescibacteria group bacterium]
MKKRIYLDHAATTYIDSRVKKAMGEFLIEKFGNPSSIYKEGRIAKQAIEESRKRIAKIIGAESEEIIFTNGGTESDNLAILGVAKRLARKVKPHIITTKIEHHAVLNPCKFLERQGFQVTYLDVGQNGIINPDDLLKVLRPETILISIMYANNEIGTIQPISEVSRIIKNFRNRQISNKSKILNTKYKIPLFHTDACQAPSYLDINVKKLGVDFMTFNGSKIYGPKGIGVLYIKKGIEIQPILFGGEQENSLRPGTENVPGIIGLAEALKISQKEKTRESRRLTALRDYFIKRLLSEIPNVFLNGHPKKRLANNINVSILGVEGESVVLYLDKAGISCSTGSACTSSKLEPSHVIMALGRSHQYAHGSIRFTLGKRTKKSDIDYTMKILIKSVNKLRNISAVKIKI